MSKNIQHSLLICGTHIYVYVRTIKLYELELWYLTDILPLWFVKINMEEPCMLLDITAYIEARW